MKKILLVIAFLVNLVPAYAADEFMLVNNTGVEIDNVYAAQSGTQQWGENILAAEVLPSGQSMKIEIDREESLCLWDFKVQRGQEENYTWNNIDLCQHELVVLNKEGDSLYVTFD